jgi:7-cyano-7-deazaguanine synthase
MSASRAVVLLSGGLDSATVLAIARAEGLECHCLTVDYGQRHRVELDAARRVAAVFGAASHRIITLDLRAIGGSALTDDIEVPKDQDPESGGVPITYVPARNTVLLSLLLGLAEVVEADQLFIGANAVDYSGYPDCRPAFLEAFENLASLATVAGAEHGVRFRVRAPLLELSKADIIRRGLELGVDYSLTWSCYDPTPSGLACGRCDSCILRRRGFKEAGFDDPTKYVTG